MAEVGIRHGCVELLKGGVRQAAPNIPIHRQRRVQADILEGIAAGQISSVGIIVVQTNGMTSANYVGNQRADLNVGADLLKGSILREMTQPQKVSPIIRATMA